MHPSTSFVDMTFITFDRSTQQDKKDDSNLEENLLQPRTLQLLRGGRNLISLHLQRRHLPLEEGDFRVETGRTPIPFHRSLSLRKPFPEEAGGSDDPGTAPVARPTRPLDAPVAAPAGGLHGLSSSSLKARFGPKEDLKLRGFEG